MGPVRGVLRAARVYTKLAWWGLASPRLTERAPLVIAQGVIRDERGRLLLSVRSDLMGWELPGGTPHPGEPIEDALRRELHEETGLEIEVEAGGLVGAYVRTGFRPHTAQVYRCRPAGGSLRPSRETPRLAWFEPAALPPTLFPWYRAPIADALAGRSGLHRAEHQGARAVLAGLRIDLRMRFGGDPASGSRP